MPKVSSHASTVGGYLWVQFRGNDNYDGEYSQLNAALYQNRALCFQKLAKWDGVVQDAGDLFVSMH